MQMIIEARLVDDVQETARIQLAVVDRELTTSPLGFSLAEGKALPACMTPELEYLQVKWAAHLPFSTAWALLTELYASASVWSPNIMAPRHREETFRPERPSGLYSMFPPLGASKADARHLLDQATDGIEIKPPNSCRPASNRRRPT